MNHTSHEVIIFTDGSSRGNPGPGGFGVVIVYQDNELKVESEKLKVKEIGGREERTTNNRMELQAAISALSFLGNYQLSAKSYKLAVYTDSSYLINGITKWVHGWQKNGWKTIAKKEVENRDLWEKLLSVSKGKSISWHLVPGHAGVAGNARCDEIATAYADNLPTKLYAGVLKNYSIADILDVSANEELLAKKDAGKKQRNGAKAYSYVSSVGGVTETHRTWAECEARVKGKPAKYKKVFSADEEQQLVAEWSRTQ